MERMTGGPNTAIAVAGRAARAGLQIRLVSTLSEPDPDLSGVRRHVADLAGGPIDEDRLEYARPDETGSVEVSPGDVCLATWWPTAYVARSAAQAGTGEFLYLIQDYEPGFYPLSTRHALAAATYAMPIRAIFNESLVRDHFVRFGVGRFGGPDAPATVVFEPAVDADLFRPRPVAADPGRRRRLLFYARPRNERNLFDLGLRALREAVRGGAFAGADWAFEFLGGQGLPPLTLSEGHTIAERPWLSYRDYAALLADSDVLLSLMLSPHTSYPPLEMASCGGVVVTNVYGGKTADALHRISPRILGVEPTVEALVAGLHEAVGLATTSASSATSPRPTLPTDWDASLAEVVPWVVEAAEELSGGLLRAGA
jgi:hypothetical protein